MHERTPPEHAQDEEHGPPDHAHDDEHGPPDHSQAGGKEKPNQELPEDQPEVGQLPDEGGDEGPEPKE